MILSEQQEIDDQYIKDYLKQQSDMYCESFVERKAKQSVTNDIESEFQELLAEITRDEELIKTLIELAAFLLDKTQAERMKNEEEMNILEEHVHSLEEKIEFEKQTVRQYQKIHQDQNEKINTYLGKIESLESELQQMENQIILLQQNQTTEKKRYSIFNKEQKLKLEEIQQKELSQVENLKKQIENLKKEQIKQKQESQSYQKSYSESLAKIQDIYNENTLLRQDKLRLEGQNKRFEMDLENLNLHNNQMENQIILLQETINNLKQQLYDLQTFQKIEPQKIHKDSSELELSQTSSYIQISRPKNLRNEGYESHRYNQMFNQEGLKRFPDVIIEKEDDYSNPSSNMHSKKHSKFQSGQYTERKVRNERPALDEVPEQGPLESQTSRHIEYTSPRPPLLSNIVQQLQEKRLNRLKIRMNVTSGLNSLQPSPRVTGPVGVNLLNLNAVKEKIQMDDQRSNLNQKIELDDEDEIPEIDGRISQRNLGMTKNKFQIQLQLPKLPLNSTAQDHYSSFAKQNQIALKQAEAQIKDIQPSLESSLVQSVQEIKVFQRPKQKNQQFSYIQLQNTLNKQQQPQPQDRMIGLRRDPYEVNIVKSLFFKEFFELVNVQYIYLVLAQPMREIKFLVYG